MEHLGQMMIFDLLLGGFILSLIGFNLVYLQKILRQSFNQYSIHFMLTIILIDIWGCALTLFLFDQLFSFSIIDLMAVLYLIGNTCLILGITNVSIIFTRPYYPTHTRRLSMLSVLFFSMLSTLAVIDLINYLGGSNSIYWIFVKSNDVLTFYTHPLVLLYIALGVTSLLLAGTIIVVKHHTFSEFLYAKEEQKRANIIRLLAILPSIGYLISSGMITGFFIFSSLSVFILTVSLLVPFSVLVYISYTRPVLFLISGIRVVPLLKQGYLGFVLAAFLDQGPEVIRISPNAQNVMKISDLSLEASTISLMAITGSSEFWANRVILVPIPTSKEVSAMTFTFLTKNPELNDPRLQTHDPVIFAILIPAFLPLSLKNCSEVLPIVLKKLREKETLSEINNEDFLIDLTIFIINKLQV